MSNISNPKDFSDLYTDLMNRVHAETSESATKIQAQRYINIALNDLVIDFREKFRWLHRRDVLQVMAPYITGTIAITKGSTSLVGISTLWDTAHDFGANNVRTTGKLVIAGTTDIYTIASVDSDTTITLNERWQDATETEGSYAYHEDEYALASDFLRPLNLQFFDTNSQIRIISKTDFFRRHPRNKTTGNLIEAAFIDAPFSANTTRVQHVIFHNPPDKFELVPYSYITSNLAVSSAGVEQADLVEDTDEPNLPLHYRHLLVYGALYAWYRDKKNDTRSQEAKKEYTDLVLRTVSDTEIGTDRPSIIPKMGAYRNRRVFTRRTPRYTLGSRFDEIR